MIFLSHNHKDKVLVEQVAVRLKDIFGQDKVFYDSWSIQPGDGIIDKMNQHPHWRKAWPACCLSPALLPAFVRIVEFLPGKSS